MGRSSRQLRLCVYSLSGICTRKVRVRGSTPICLYPNLGTTDPLGEILFGAQPHMSGQWITASQFQITEVAAGSLRLVLFYGVQPLRETKRKEIL
jgi:hypothetical protein